MRLGRVAGAAVVALFAMTLASAQTGGMKVRVYDSKDNSGMPGAVVVLSHATGNVAPYTVQTDVDGYAIFPVLRAGGGYILEVSFPGYAKVHLTDQRVKISETSVIPIGMTEAIQEKVEVVATRQTIDIEQTQTSTKFNDEFLKDLPIPGRAYQNVLALVPGVTDDDGDGNPNVAGSRETDFKAVVGGVSNVDPFSGERLNYVNPDSIEEIEVITGGAGVELGRAQGGFARIVQKQGTNEFEGKFGMLYRSSQLDGHGANNNNPDRLFPDFKSYQPSITVSGPMKKDRLWYILNYEYHHDEAPVIARDEGVVVTRVQPIGSGTVTWQASPRNKLAFKYEYDPITSTNLGAAEDPLRDAANLTREEVGGPVYSVRWSAPYSPKLLVESTLAYQDSHSNELPMTDAAGPDGRLGTADDDTSHYNECARGLGIFAGSDCTNLINGETTASSYRTHRDRRQRLTVSTDADIFGGKFWGMNQQFKVGFIVENERYFEDNNLQPNSVFFEQQGQGNIEVGKLITTFYIPQIYEARATGTTFGVYASDEMKPINNLTIKPGIRFDREAINSRGVLPIDPDAEAARLIQITAPPPLGNSLPIDQSVVNTFTAYENMPFFLSELGSYFGATQDQIVAAITGIANKATQWVTPRRPGDINLVNDNVSPNLSISWDPWNNAKTKFTVTAGRYYNNIPLLIPTLELQPPNTAVEIELQTGGECPPAPAPCPRWQVPSSSLHEIGLNPSINFYQVDRNLKTPHTDEFTFSFDRELTAETVFRLTYIKRKKKDDIQDIDINHGPGDYGTCEPDAGRDPFDPNGYVIQGPRTAQNPTGGDGVIDDCIGRVIFVNPGGDPGNEGGGSNNQVELPQHDNIPDAYILNPAWGSINLVGNFNTSNYDAVTVLLDRRLYRGWQLNGSYTWSRNIGQAESFLQELGDDRSLVQEEYGLLGIDVTHSVKINATAIVPWGFRLGGSVSWQSGYPYSVTERAAARDTFPPQYVALGVPTDPRLRTVYPSHVRNDQRNEPFWLMNVHLAKDMNLKGGKTLELSADIFNLLNQPHQRILIQNNGRSAVIQEFGRQYQLAMSLAF